MAANSNHRLINELFQQTTLGGASNLAGGCILRLSLALGTLSATILVMSGCASIKGPKVPAVFCHR